MALEEVTAAFLRRFSPSIRPLPRVARLHCRSYASQTSDTADLDQSTFLSSSDIDTQYDPTKRQRENKQRLPASRYRFRSPRYNRGALHPHQPLKATDPNSREFVPGPFSLPRLEQTYNDTFAPDIMTMTYQHFPPGQEPHKKGARLRPWIGDSPYFKNRPLRGPRGGEVLRLLRKPITPHNIPALKRVTVHSMVKGALSDSGHLVVAGMALQAITGVRAQTHAVTRSLAGFNLRAGRHVSVTCDLEGEDMYHFLSKVVDVVMPKIKDYKGIKGSSGDSSGNIAFGFTPEQLGLFPEIEVNYDAYPPKMIPGCHIIVHTTASTDRDARMLLQAVGIPFYGKYVD
ncbi:hypothetical protein AMS68_003854 [Peltaster fructicola]|uniref:Large ribosomal subunit protein uL5m n=1 Tax=Peltaster fructicola TaxID=286661 RepID=A0A6H0XU88_9PEZI|nr:hypothetical protein AMS68_003854 [Peltaster fructicola]